jgi:hypothetical protein
MTLFGRIKSFSIRPTANDGVRSTGPASRATDGTGKQCHGFSEAIAQARRYLIANFPKEGEHLLTTALLMGFTDLMIHTAPAAQLALADAVNNKLAGTPWRLVERAN